MKNRDLGVYYGPESKRMPNFRQENKNEMEANMENGLYMAHEVAVIIADLLGDDCACNFNDNDEWLPFKCELLDACPNPCGVACWEQYLKYRHCKKEMEEKEDGK